MITKILTTEQRNKQHIYLHKEKLFWLAYEQSAYLFATHVRPYRVQKRRDKKSGTDIVSTGFPNAVIARIELPIISRSEELIVIQAPEYIDDAKFTEWRAEIPLFVKNRGRRNQFVSTVPTIQDVVLKRFRDFDLTRSTPIDCMNLIAELKSLSA